MSRCIHTGLAVRIAAVLLLLAFARKSPADDDATTCSTHGTAISWVADLETAQRLARQQSKLVFVVHLSGNFANKTFT